MPAKKPFRGILSTLWEEDKALTRLCHRLGVNPSLPDAEKYELIGRELAPKEKEFRKRGRPPSPGSLSVTSDDELLSLAVDCVKKLRLASTDEEALEFWKNELSKDPQSELTQLMCSPHITMATRLKKISQGRRLRKRREEYKADTRQLDFDLRKKT